MNLPTRVHTLLTGPSGSGKSFLARALAKEAGVPIWEGNVPQAKRKDLILRFAGEALAHAADKLTDDEILACAQEDPYSALRERRKFIPEFRAKILAQVIPMVRLSPVCIPGGLESDILESIAKFPSLWLDQYGTFVIAMDQIAKHLSIIPDGRTLEKLYHRMDPAGKDAYFHFMADRL